MLIPDGFPGQRLRVLPRPLVREALARPVTSRLLVTDAGEFPRAAEHGRSRVRGAHETIVILCTTGAGHLQLGDDEYDIAAGDAAIIPAYTPHKYWADSVDPWTIWWVHVAGSDAAELTAAVLGEQGHPIVATRDVYSAVALVEQIVTALERDETTATLREASGAAWNLLAQLASDRLRGPAGTADRIQIVQDYLRQHLDSHTSVSELARLAGLSTSHFSAMFKTATGMGVVEYVKRLRNARARELLISTEATVADIARSVGYPDAFYFSRQFHAINGTSPTEYRLSYNA
jgi:AraC-like DNA-binding protein/uncharacterized RmlC-like cupin family protein